MAIQSFRQLVAPMSVDMFFTEYFGRKPVHIKGNPKRTRPFMNWATLNEILASIEYWNADNFRLIRNGRHAPPHVYCRPTPATERGPVQRPVRALVEPQLRTGATLALYYIQSMTGGLRALTGMVEEALGGRAQMNLYASWVKEKGLQPHFDTHDVFALHIEGRKQWKIYDTPVEHPVAHEMFSGAGRERLDAIKRNVLMQPELEAGSILYIPRGYYHEALGMTDSCFHIALGVHYPVGLDVLTAIWPALSANPLFRRKLPRVEDDDSADLDAHLAALGEACEAAFRDPKLRHEMTRLMATFRTERFRVNLPHDVVADRKAGKK